ncbi:MAG: SurA N-terminal domain-containing protein [Desulfobacterales bacterium]|nr:SurA N-terminal domain-containing protein [Desulfobacterales bacterium]
MLSLMRKHATSWIIKIMIGIIAVVFVLSYGAMRQSDQNVTIAEVNDEPITIEEYKDAYDRMVERFRQQFGQNLNSQMLEMLQVKRQALDSLINEKLMLQEAKHLGIRVSDQELTDSIASIGAFQTAGVFDIRRYEDVLNRNKLTPKAFESIQRQAILSGKLQSFITGAVKLSEAEIREWFNWQNAAIDLEFVLFDPKTKPSIASSLEDIKEYYEKNKETYKTEAMVKVDFVRFKPEDYLEGIEIDDQAVLDYYNERKEEFITPKTIEARHILFKVEQNASTEEVAQQKQQAQDVLAQVRAGGDFATLAQEYSQGPSKDRGGYLGTFKRETMVKPFADKAFAMQAGEVSEPVRTNFGWHIIKVEKVNAASTQSFDQAKSKIATKLKNERARNRAFDAADAVYDDTFNEDKLTIIAENRDLQLIQTDFFTRQGPAQDVQDRSKFAAEAFKLSDQDFSEVLDLNDGYYIVQMNARAPEKIADFKDVEEKVKMALIKEKQENQAREAAQTFLAALKEGQTMTAQSRQFDLKPQTTGFFKRNQPIPQIGYESELATAAFQLTTQQPLPANPVSTAKGVCVFRLIERKIPSDEEFAKEKETVTKQLLQNKKFKTLNAWLEQLKSKSSIVVQEQFFGE